jgi:hypothetical protein
MIYTKEQAEVVEYDLNVFYQDLGRDHNGVNQWSNVYTIQPSVYVGVDDGTSLGRTFRLYLNAFTLTLEETRAIAPDFPESEWGDDFFVTLDYFLELCQTLPNTVKAKLDKLPPLDSYTLDTDAYGEREW